MKKPKKRPESGNSLIETVIAMGVFSAVLAPFILSVSNLFFSQAKYGTRIQAAQYAREGLEITYNIAVNTDSWENFVDDHLGSFYPNVGGDGLELVELGDGEEELIEGGIFTRKITMAKAWRDDESGEIVDEETVAEDERWEDANTLEVVSKVSWQERGEPQEVEFTTYLISFEFSDVSPSPSPSPNDNLLENGNFETGSLSPWSRSGDFQIEGSTVHQGNYSAKLDGSGELNQVFSTVAGQTYNASVWLRIDSQSGSESWGGLRLLIYDYDWTELEWSAFYTLYGPFSVHVSPGGWFRIDLQFTAISDRARVYLQNHSGTYNFVAYWDEARVW